ncbi:MAG: tetratricopeptide repeat protein, partial [Planctomycetales bacterium]|nr:tetratricopeptide repeat protein [Planctomycetales bacterium]
NNSVEIEKAKNNFFVSLVRFNQESKSWVKPTASQWNTNQINWRDDFPSSVSNAIATTFERQLAETPDHEATLRVMQTYYHRIHDVPDKRRMILVRLREIYQKRGETFDIESEMDFASLQLAAGQQRQAAEIYSALGSQFRGLRASTFFLLEAKAWIADGDQDKATLALNKSYKQCISEQQSTTGFQLDQIGDAFVSVNQNKDAIECYKRALRFEKNPTQFQLLQGKLAKLVDASRPVAEPMVQEETVEDLLDPKRKFQLEAQNLEARATGSASSVFMTMTAAADAWIKAEDVERAEKALKKAVVAQRRITDTSRSRNEAQLADLFRRIGQNQQAVDHYLQSLKITPYETDIEKYQIEIAALTQEDSTISIADDDRALLDPKYKFRVQARQAENQTSYGDENKATNLMRACEFWAKAGDKDDVLRCGLAAESSIGKIVSDSPNPPQERHYAKLAKIYLDAELNEPGVRCLVAAITFAPRDDQAVKYHQEAKAVAERNGFAMPELDAKAAVKLDPLNRYRVQAAKDEQDAAKQTGSGAMYRLMSAIKNWIKAEEKDEAIRTANQYARLLLADKSDSGFDRKCEDLGDIFVQLERADAAKKCFEEAIQATKYDFRKESIQKKIDAL